MMIWGADGVVGQYRVCAERGLCLCAERRGKRVRVEYAAGACGAKGKRVGCACVRARCFDIVRGVGSCARVRSGLHACVQLTPAPDTDAAPPAPASAGAASFRFAKDASTCGAHVCLWLCTGTVQGTYACVRTGLMCLWLYACVRRPPVCLWLHALCAHAPPPTSPSAPPPSTPPPAAWRTAPAAPPYPSAHTQACAWTVTPPP